MIKIHQLLYILSELSCKSCQYAKTCDLMPIGKQKFFCNHHTLFDKLKELSRVQQTVLSFNPFELLAEKERIRNDRY